MLCEQSLSNYDTIKISLKILNCVISQVFVSKMKVLNNRYKIIIAHWSEDEEIRSNIKSFIRIIEKMSSLFSFEFIYYINSTNNLI